MLFSNRVPAIAGALLLAVSSVAPAATTIFFDSAQGERLFQGVDAVFTDADGTTINTASATHYRMTGPDFGWRFEIAAPADEGVLAPGNFVNAERAGAGNPKLPGMSISNAGRGCNALRGHFFIHEYDVSGPEPVVAFDFVHYCDSDTVALKGGVRTNSDVAYPYPGVVAVANVPLWDYQEDDRVALGSGYSYTHPSATVGTYHWRQLSGPEVTLEVVPPGITTFVVPRGIDMAGETVALQLDVYDSAGRSDSVPVNVRVTSKSAPKTFLSLQSEAGDYIGQGRDWYFDNVSSRMAFRLEYGYAPNVQVTGSSRWNAVFSAPFNAELTAGHYEPVQRFPFQAEGTAGMQVSGDGRGCNEVSGSFDVIEGRGDSAEPSFRATFEQWCSGSSAPLRGEVSFNALHPSVPAAHAGEDFTTVDNEDFQLDGTGSQDAQPLTFAWNTASTAVEILDPASPAPTVRPAGNAPAAGRPVVFTVTVTDADGYHASDQVTVTLVPGNEPPVAMDDQASFHPAHGVIVDVRANDYDPDQPVASLYIDFVEPAQFGRLTLLPDGRIAYEPLKGQKEKTDGFSYRLIDQEGAVSNVATVSLSR